MTGFPPSASARPIFWQARSLAFAACFGLAGSSVKAQEAPPPPPKPVEEPTATPTALSQVGPLYIQEYRVRGNKILKPIDIEKAVYPYLGPGRSENDIEQARQGLEKAYRGLGYQTVYVEVPKQTGARGVIYLNVVEAPVGRLRIKGAKYFLPSKIKEKAQSMAEGTVPNFNEVQKEIMALNRWRDRKITPELRAGVVPGTVDIDLIVEDKNPFHGNLELNNIHNANTVPLRLNGSLSYSEPLADSATPSALAFRWHRRRPPMAPSSPATTWHLWKTTGASWSPVPGRIAISPRSAAAPSWVKARSTASAS
jgi:hemolysin activation/secretion protein